MTSAPGAGLNAVVQYGFFWASAHGEAFGLVCLGSDCILMESITLFIIKNLLPCMKNLFPSVSALHFHIRAFLSTLSGNPLFGFLGGGGRFICLLFLLSVSALKAQTTCNESNTLPLECNQLGVEIKPVTSTQTPCYNCNLEPLNCHQTQFEVFLVTNGIPPGYPSTFCLDYDAITVSLRVSGTNPAGLPSTTTIDKDATLNCSAGLGFDDFLEVDEADQLVNFIVGTGETPPPLVFSSSNSGCVGNNTRSVKLFTIVVNTGMGETVTVDCADLFYHESENEISCFLEDENTPPQVISCSGATYSPPTLSNQPNLTVDLGGFYFTGTPQYGVIPVQINTTLSSFRWLDFSLRLDMENLMQTPELDFSNAPFQPVYSFIIPIPGTNDWYVYARYENISSLNSGTTDLFDILVNPPMYITCGGEVTADLERGRLETTQGCGWALLGDPETLDFGDCPGICDEAYSIDVSGYTISGIQNDCKIQVLLGFNWQDAQTSTYDFHHLRLRLDFTASDQVVLESVDLNGVITNSNPNYVSNPTACPGHNDYAEISADGHSLTICYDNPGGFYNGLSTIDRLPPYLILTFDAPDGGCVDDVTLREAEFGRVFIKNGVTQYGAICTIDPDTDFDKSNLPVCAPFVKTTVRNAKTSCPEAVENVNIEISDGSACILNGLTSCAGYATCVCDYDTYTVTPMKDDNPMNGVSTFDLALMSKHIIGVEPFDSPFKIIAADVNKSNTLTSFDIVELRKLILGVYTDFPENTSWRFIDDSFVFTDPANPFIDIPFPESVTLPVSISNPGEAGFIAIKIGDVNLSHIAGCAPTDPGCKPAPGEQSVGQIPTGLSAPEGRTGDVVTLALQHEGAESLSAVQAGLSFDPERWEFVGISMGELGGISPGCFNLERIDQGDIRLVWLSPDFEEQLWQPGQALCYFTLQARAGTQGVEALRLDPAHFACEAYTLDNRRFQLVPGTVQARQAAKPLVQARMAPNPTSGTAQLELDNPSAQTLRLMVFSAFGGRVAYHEASLPAGPCAIEAPELASQPAGVYTWVLLNGSKRLAEGRIVKL